MKNSLAQQIDAFLSAKAYGVVGATHNRSKFGNKVLRAYVKQQKTVYPVNPSEKIIEDLACVPHVQQLPPEVTSISIITPPPVTEKVVEYAIAVGHIKNIWIQPGAESTTAIELAKTHGINVIAQGPCILVRFGFSE